MDIITRTKHNTTRYYILIQNRKGFWEEFIGDLFRLDYVMDHLLFFSVRERFLKKRFRVIKAVYINNRQKEIKDTLAEGDIISVMNQLKEKKNVR